MVSMKPLGEAWSFLAVAGDAGLQGLLGLQGVLVSLHGDGLDDHGDAPSAVVR